MGQKFAYADIGQIRFEETTGIHPWLADGDVTQADFGGAWPVQISESRVMRRLGREHAGWRANRKRIAGHPFEVLRLRDNQSLMMSLGCGSGLAHPEGFGRTFHSLCGKPEE